MKAKRGRGRPKLHTEPVERSQVSLPVSVSAKLRKAGNGSLSAGIIKANAWVEAWSKKSQLKRSHRLVVVTDPDEILAIQRGDLTDPVGGVDKEGIWRAERATLDAYRKSLGSTPGDR